MSGECVRSQAAAGEFIRKTETGIAVSIGMLATDLPCSPNSAKDKGAEKNLNPIIKAVSVETMSTGQESSRQESVRRKGAAMRLAQQ
jgi:hypothetical protein